MRTFIDERDAGSLILTHLYLLVGCAAPVWLYTPANPSEGTSGVPRSHLSLVWLLTGVVLVMVMMEQMPTSCCPTWACCWWAWATHSRRWRGCTSGGSSGPTPRKPSKAPWRPWRWCFWRGCCFRYAIHSSVCLSDRYVPLRHYTPSSSPRSSLLTRAFLV